MFKFVKAKSCLIIFASCVFMAFGVYNIHSLSGITEGGVLGATLLLEHWFNISPAITTIILNAICYFIGWKVLGKKFIFYSFFGTICYSLSYAIFEIIGPLFPEIANNQLLAAVFAVSTMSVFACWFTESSFNATYIASVNGKVVHYRYVPETTKDAAVYNNGIGLFTSCAAFVTVALQYALHGLRLVLVDLAAQSGYNILH